MTMMLTTIDEQEAAQAARDSVAPRLMELARLARDRRASASAEVSEWRPGRAARGRAELVARGAGDLLRGVLRARAAGVVAFTETLWMGTPAERDVREVIVARVGAGEGVVIDYEAASPVMWRALAGCGVIEAVRGALS